MWPVPQCTFPFSKRIGATVAPCCQPSPATVQETDSPKQKNTQKKQLLEVACLLVSEGWKAMAR